jgi:lysophospholipase L1-like esterase
MLPKGTGAEDVFVGEPRQILCFGDSLTWGSVPVESAEPGWRYSFEQRWAGVMQEALGVGYRVVEDAVVTRTTNAEDPVHFGANGSRHLPASLASNGPLDMVIFLLGTNDLKAHFNRTPIDITRGLSGLVSQVHRDPAMATGGTPKVLIVAPPALSAVRNPWLASMFDGAHEKSQQLADLFALMASFEGVEFMDAGRVISRDGCDGIHLTASSNLELGLALASRVQALLGAWS